MKKKTFKTVLMAVALIACLVVCAILYLRNEECINQQQDDFVQALQQEKGAYNPGRIILRNMNEKTAIEFAAKINAEIRWADVGNIAVLILDDGSDVMQIASNREYSEYVVNMSVDYYVSLCNADLSDKSLNAFDVMSDLNIQDTWDITTGEGVTIAVIDTGIDTDSTVFSGRISDKSYNATQDKVVSDYDWSVVEDEVGHGTGIASIISASSDDTTGISGIAPSAELLVIKCEADEDDQYNSSDMLFALAYAIEQDVDIINMSFWVKGNINPFEEYTKLAVDSDIICVAAAGNMATSVLGWPAADENVIGVGAVRDQSRGSSSVSSGIGYIGGYRIYELDELSNYGDNSDVVAPNAMCAIGLEGEIKTLSGTSVSSAMVAGATALYLSQNKYTEFSDFREVLFASTVDKGITGEDWYYGFGMLDIYSLVVAEKGIITLDYLTDELKNRTQIFVIGHKIQVVDEPEREYAVFDGWYYDINCMDEFDYLNDSLHKDLILYASWVNEDDTMPYTYRVLDDQSIEITGYRGKRRYISIPSQIDGFTVTSIGDGAFCGNSRIRGVTLPDTLENIGPYAFADCVRLLSIDIPKTVETIGDHAFENNSRLAQVSIVSDSALKTIGDYAFAYCGMLTRFDIPNNLEEITGLAFYGATGILQITTTTECDHYEIIEWALCRKDEEDYQLVYFPGGIRGTYIIPEKAKVLGQYAFSYSLLTSVTLNDGLIEIGKGCFTHASLETVSIPGSVRFIPTECFSYCSDLATAYLEEGIYSIGSYAFQDCGNLEQVHFPDTLSEISEGSFLRAYCLKQITYYQPCIQVIESNAFSCCAITDIGFIGSKIRAIGDYAFMCCPVESVKFPASLKELGESAFKWCQYLSNVEFEDGIELSGSGNKLEDGLFSGCYNLEIISIPESIEIIGVSCFADSGLTRIEFAAGIQEIQPGAISGCHQLKEVYVSEDNACYYAKDHVLYYCDPDTAEITLHSYPAGLADLFIIPDEVNYIGAYAFAHNTKLKSVTFNRNLKSIGGNAFAFAYSLEEVVYQDGLMEIGDSAFSQCYALTEQVFPDSLQTIGTYAFENCYQLKQIVFSKNLISIGYCAFISTSSLTDVTFRDETVISRLGNSAFAGSGIVSIEIPASVTSMGQNVFAGCSNLQEVTFAPNSQLTYLPAWVFKGADCLTSITFGEGSALENIQARALEYLGNLVSINLEACSNLTKIDNYAFQFCSSLTNIKLPEKVEYIGRYAFYCCSSLTELAIPETVEYIGRYAFTYANQIRIYFASAGLPLYLQDNWDYDIGGYYLGTNNVITDGDWSYAVLADGTVCIVAYAGTDTELDLTTVAGYSVSSIGTRAFANNTLLENAVLPSTLLSICDQAFLNTDSLKQISIPASVSHIGKAAFEGSGITNVVFEEGIELDTLGVRSFANTSNLQMVEVPDSVTEISDYAFYQSSLQTVTFSDQSSLMLIGRYAFAESKLKEVQLPVKLEKVDYYAFAGTSDLSGVAFGTETSLSLYGYAFYNSGLELVHLPANVNYVGEFCFVNCEKLEAFEVSEDSTYYASRDGILFNKELTRIVCCPAGKTGTYEIPGNVSVLGFAAFEGSKLSSVTIPKDSLLTTLGYRAFFNCDGIKDIYIPSTVLSIDYYAFAYCSNLATVTIAKGSQMCGIYEGAFYGCEKLENITIPDTVKEITELAFGGCVNLRTVNISENSQLAGVFDQAFYDSGITQIHLPETVCELGDQVFAYTKLESLVVPNSVKEIGSGILTGNDVITSLTLPFLGETNDGDGTIGYTFDCDNSFLPSSLTMVTITGMDSVPYNAFAACQYLTTVCFTNPVVRVGPYAFYKCAALNSVDFLKDTITIDEKAFTGCSGIEGALYLDCLQTVGLEAFEHCMSITEVYIGDAQEIGVRAFLQCDNLQKVEIYGKNAIIRDSAFMWNNSLTDIILHDGIVEIEECCFWGIPNVTIDRLVIPGSVKFIGAQAFEGWYAINQICIGEGVEHIGSNAFNCAQEEGVGFVYLPESVLTIEPGAFDSSYIFCTGQNHADGWMEGWCAEGTRFYYGCSAPVETEDGYTYLTCSNGAILLDYSGSETNLTIDTVGGHAVFAVGSYAFAGNSPVETVTFAESVKEIHDQAFYQAANLTEVVMDYPLEVMGDLAFAYSAQLAKVILRGDTGYHAFMSCKNLQTVKIFDSKICQGTFADCTALTDVTLENIASISNYAFKNCSVLTNIAIPGTVDSIGEYAFDYCLNLSKVTLGDGIKSIGGCAFGRTAISSIVIPDSVTFMGRSVFYESKLKEISLGSGITFVSEGMFKNSLLETVVLGDQITSIGEYAFYSCDYLSSVVLGNQTADIGAGAFKDCFSLREIYVPETVTSIGAESFANSSKLFVLFGADVLPEFMGENWDLGVRGYALNSQETAQTDADTQLQYYVAEGGALICGYAGTAETLTISTVGDGIPVIEILNGVFQENVQLKTVFLGPSVKLIDDCAFYRCDELTTVEFAENSALEVIGNSAFESCGKLKNVDLAKNCLLKRIGNRAFTNCGLETLTIPEGVVQIGEYVFADNINLISVSLPSSLETIAASAFSYCLNLSELNLSKGIVTIGEYAFSHCYGLEDVVLPESLVEIQNEAFFYCVNLQSISIPDSVEIVAKAFTGCHMLGEEDSGLRYIDDCLIGIEDTLLTEVTVREGTTIICGGAFERLSTLTRIELPDSLKTIGSAAFYECTGLIELKLPDGLCRIGEEAFWGCTGLTDLIIPNSVESIGESALYRTTSLEYLSLPFIGGSATCENGLGYLLRNKSFYKDTYQSLKTVVITGDVDRIPSKAFELWNNPIEEIWFVGRSADSVVIEENAFCTASNLKSIVLPENIVSIGASAFCDCTSLKSVDLNEGLQSIGNHAFAGCRSFTSVKLPNSLQSIGEAAFKSCTGLTEIVVPNNVQFIGMSAFEGCDSLEKMSLPFAGSTETETGIWRLFSTSAYPSKIPQTLKEVTITGKITELSGAFGGCSYLEKVHLPEGLLSIGWNSFTGCSSLKYVSIPTTVTYIGQYAFDGCNSLECLVLPAGMEEIDNEALRCSIDTLVILNGDCVPRELYSDVSNLVIQYTGSLPVVPKENLVLLEGSYGLSATCLAELTDVHIFCCESENAVPWPEGWNNGNAVSYEGEWRYIQFRVDGFVVKDEIQKNSEVIHLPTKSLYTKMYENGTNCTFVGWDVTGDSKADNLLVTNRNGFVIADAVYSVISGDMISDNTVTEESIKQMEDQLILDAFEYDNHTSRVSVRIPHRLLPDMPYVVKTNLGSIAFGAEGVATINSSVSKDLVVSLELIPVDLLSKATVGEQIYALDVTAGNQKVLFGSAMVTVPCDISGDVSNLRVYRITDDGSMVDVEFVYDSYTKKITFTAYESGLYMIPGPKPICLEHTYEETVTVPTCTEQGYTTHFCVVCDYYYADSYVDATGHNFSSHITNGDGTKTAYCQNPNCNAINVVHAVSMTLIGLPIKMEYMEVEPLDLTGLVVYVTYSDGTGEYITDYTISGTETITVSYGDACASFKVIIHYYGDVNDDGVVNELDLQLMRQYLAGRDPQTGESVMNLAVGADCNGDGLINAIDLAMLCTYLTEGTVQFGPKN